MSEDEVIVVVICALLGLWLWIRYYGLLISVTQYCSSQRERSLMYGIPPLCGVLLFGILRTAASHDVRDDSLYLFFYMVMGAAWVGATKELLPLFGLSPRDDVAERANRAASSSIAGAMIGLTLCFAGGNIGDGPGWWVVVFSGALSTGSFFLMWFFIERVTHVSDAITVDRDSASGMRLTGVLVGLGLTLGRAVAGNWRSAGETVADFMTTAWPVLPLIAVAIVGERIFQPSRGRPTQPIVSHGIVPGLVYVAMAAFYVWQKGHW